MSCRCLECGKSVAHPEYDKDFRAVCARCRRYLAEQEELKKLDPLAIAVSTLCALGLFGVLVAASYFA